MNTNLIRKTLYGAGVSLLLVALLLAANLLFGFAPDFSGAQQREADLILISRIAVSGCLLAALGCMKGFLGANQ